MKSWTPTRLGNGEGRAGQGSNRPEHLFRSTGVLGTARREGGPGNRGRPVLGEGRGLNATLVTVPAGVGQGHKTFDAG